MRLMKVLLVPRSCLLFNGHFRNLTSPSLRLSVEQIVLEKVERLINKI